ncbi:GNAT family N-acetyltransferase [Rubrobacter tropicus]|uniref:GNAT family N-acetyltransferase n=1 Tax=Rubrobacter tropicus TaxID=2653851 RepID=A0A6G8Q869_9ACTN|nr:GNAT family N-acetyltransferase [Rubrobacter tropicus]QIN82671.1 GNAT family N-acetyltransferase [Rubrobacter tropicus]
MEAEQFTVRFADAKDDPAIAGLVVEGFLDKFRPIFGGRMDRSLRIMEKWVTLEHASGGVTSLVTEGYSTSELAGSVGVRTAPSREDILARGLWRSLTRNLGLPRAMWATTLLSYPRYSHTSSEAYVERLVVSPSFRRQGIARGLLSAAEDLARDSGKETVGLHVSSNNLSALRLYEAEGYREVSRQKSFLTSYFLDIREWLYLQKTL